LNTSEYEARWSVTGSDGKEIQSGILNLVDCMPGKQIEVKIPADQIRNPKPGDEYWLRVSFYTRTDSLWAKAGHEIAWQQMKLDVKTPAIPKIKAGKLPLTIAESSALVHIAGTNFSVAFSRFSGTLASLEYGGRELLSQDSDDYAGPVLQIFRTPTDNDKGFGKWLARDWREAGLSNMVRRVDSFEINQPTPGEVRVVIVATSTATNGVFVHHATWTIRGDGSLEMDNRFECSSSLATLPRVGVVMRVDEKFKKFRWYGRGPFENYSDRKESVDTGVWRSTVDEQYVSYVRPQENGNKEDVRWLTLTDDTGTGLKVTAEENPMAASALHFTAMDLAAAKHDFELKPRPEVILSLDAKQCGLGNGSCGPGVLEKYSVPPESYTLKLRFAPVK